MTKYIHIVFLLLTFLSNCKLNKKTKCSSCNNLKIENITNNNKKLINFKHIKDFSINFNGDINSYRAEQIIKQNNNINIIYYYADSNRLAFFDINKKTHIKDTYIPKGEISNFYVQNKDSIFLFYKHLTSKNNNHDSTIVLINETGKIIKYYDINDANVVSPENKYKNNDSLMYLHLQFIHPPVYENNKLFLTFLRKCAQPLTLGGPDFFKVQLPVAGYLDTKRNKYVGLKKIKYPYINDSIYYSTGYAQIRLISLHNNKEILISFDYTPLIYKYNYISNKITKINSFKSVFNDSIYPAYKKPETTLIFDNYSYNLIRFEEENNRYIRHFIFPYKKHLSSIIFADSLFNVTAEGISPKGYSFITSISKDTLLFFNSAKSFNFPNKLYFSLFTIDKAPGLTQKIYFEIKSKEKKDYDIKDYVTKITKTKKENYATVIIPVDFSCPGCVKETLKFFSNNKKKISEIPVYLIISSEMGKRTKTILSNYNLDNNFKNIFFDKTTKYLYYHPNNKGYNPRLILTENNKIISDKIYDAKKIKKLQDDLIAFLLKHKYIKGYK